MYISDAKLTFSTLFLGTRKEIKKITKVDHKVKVISNIQHQQPQSLKEDNSNSINNVFKFKII